MHSIACRKHRKKRHSIIDRDKSREIDTRNEQKRPRKRCNRMQFLPTVSRRSFSSERPNRWAYSAHSCLHILWMERKGREKKIGQCIASLPKLPLRDDFNGDARKISRRNPMRHRTLTIPLALSFTARANSFIFRRDINLENHRALSISLTAHQLYPCL